MFLRFRVWKWRFTFTLSPVVKVTGVNSILDDKKHILLWDFDDVEEQEVWASLKHIQKKEHLPTIYLLHTSNGNHYCAYCFKRCDWWTCKRIIASTPYTDEEYFKYGVNRGYFTLRVSAKHNMAPHLVATLPSKVRETATIDELESWVVYETLDKKK